MASVGRFFCVALPFALTLLSLIFLLVACLGGVTNKDLYMFQVNTTDLSISPNSIKGLVTRDIVSDVKDLVNGGGDAVVSGSGGSNITAADLGLGNYYDVSLWGYCVTDADGDKECTKAKFDWANGILNSTIQEKIKAATGKKLDVPDEVVKGLDAFATVAKWTEVVYIIALVALAVQLFFGAFASCSRALSCITFIVSGVASVAVLGAAGMSTAMSVVVVGTVESTAKLYGVEGSFNVTFLILIWLSAAFALGAGFFWLFTICCCAPDHGRRHSKRKSADAEKLLPTGAYQPLNDPEMSHGYYRNSQYGAPRHPSGAPRSDMAYEPYSHKG